MNVINIYKFIGSKFPQYKIDDFGGNLYKFPKENGLRDKNGRKTGEWKTYHENKQVSSVGEYVNGKREGMWSTFWRNGQLKTMGRYESDLQQGKWIKYYSDGEIWDVGNFIDGKPQFMYQGEREKLINSFLNEGF